MNTFSLYIVRAAVLMYAIRRFLDILPQPSVYIHLEKRNFHWSPFGFDSLGPLLVTLDCIFKGST